MCGLVGSWHPDGRHPEALANGLDTIAHRGPDGEGWHNMGLCRLGHRRLSIVDVDGGRQPLLNEDGRLAMVHNGEIYNHRELLSLLSGTHSPRSRSDGEAWLHTAEEQGPVAAAAALHGMFALAASDGHDVCLARDAMGIKPLYWSHHDGGISFASEIKALLSCVPAASIQAFPPGHVYTNAGGLQRLQRTSVACEHASLDAAGWAEALLALLEESVRLRLMADVPIGVFLSGGLDSSLIAGLMRRRIEQLQSFAVGLAGSTDLARAREVAHDLGTIHHEVVIDEDELIAAIEPVIWHLESWDPDLVRSALPCWFLARAAAQHVKVVLTGEGADELFAGYDYHRQYAGDALQGELRRSVSGLHHCNLQRVDRMTMAHGLEARVPFLDTRVVAMGLAIPTGLKIGHGWQKLLLRRIANGILPPEIAWRTKEQFDHGSGTAAAIRRLIGDADQEAQYYRRIFDRHFPSDCGHLVNHWARGRLDADGVRNVAAHG